MENINQQQQQILDIINKTAKEAGVSVAMQKIGTAVLWAESNLDPNAVCKNRFSVDRGLAQINSYWWKDVSVEQAFDPEFSARFFWKWFPRFPQWWIAWKNKSYQKFLMQV